MDLSWEVRAKRTCAERSALRCGEAVKTKRTQRRCDEALRREAVALVESTGQALAEIAQPWGVTQWNLRDWLPLCGKKAGQPSTAPERESQ